MLGAQPLSHAPISSIAGFSLSIRPIGIVTGEVFGTLDFALLDLTVFEIFFTPHSRGTIWLINDLDD